LKALEIKVSILKAEDSNIDYSEPGESDADIDEHDRRSMAMMDWYKS
jgi:hypothetical protein